MRKIVPHTERIRFWNDHLRKFHRGGKVLLTQGVASLDTDTQVKIMQAVADFDGFTPDNDPHEEHDFAILTVRGHRIMFKIDYYDPSMSFRSMDPASPLHTKRVLTIMLSEEY